MRLCHARCPPEITNGSVVKRHKVLGNELEMITSHLFSLHMKCVPGAILLIHTRFERTPLDFILFAYIFEPMSLAGHSTE